PALRPCCLCRPPGTTSSGRKRRLSPSFEAGTYETAHTSLVKQKSPPKGGDFCFGGRALGSVVAPKKHPQGPLAAGREYVDLDMNRFLHHAPRPCRQRHHHIEQVPHGATLLGQDPVRHPGQCLVAHPHIRGGEGGATDEVGQLNQGIAFAHWATPDTSTKLHSVERAAASRRPLRGVLISPAWPGMPGSVP